MTYPTDALRLVPRRATPQQLEAAAFNLSAEIGAEEAMKLGPHIELAYELLVAAAPASPLPGGGQLSKNLGELSGWQDISTAPKDGTPLLAGSIHHSDREVVCWQDGLPSGSMIGVMNSDAPEEGWVNEGPHKDRFYANPRYFTHWQPLPAAPTGAK